MSLAAQQEAFLRLTTSLADQEQFFADPERIGAAWGLDCSTVQQLLAQEKDIRRFGRSLHNKRRHELASLLPGLRRALGPEFANWFRRYCRECPGAGQQPREREAHQFAAYVACQTRLPTAVYEEAAWRARAGNHRLVVCWLGGWRWAVWCRLGNKKWSWSSQEPTGLP